MTTNNQTEQIRKFFNENKFVALGNILTAEECQFAVNRMFQKQERGDKPSTDRCKLSISYYSVFDDMLEKLLPFFENATGLKLHPTYSYARIYKPGETLRVHIDRDACEISSTITLGFKGESIWPFFVSQGKDKEVINNDDKTEIVTSLINPIKVIIPVGCGIVYRGKEIYHWREEYKEGEWQVQVFLHYVNADGPLAHLKYNGRESLNYDCGK